MEEMKEEVDNSQDVPMEEEKVCTKIVIPTDFKMFSQQAEPSRDQSHEKDGEQETINFSEKDADI